MINDLSKAMTQLRDPKLLKILLLSLALAVLVMGLLIFGVVLVGWFGFLQGRLDTSALMDVVEANGLRSPGRYVAMALWMSFGNALAEEFVFRWFVDSRLKELGVPLILAVPLSALIFTAQ